VLFGWHEGIRLDVTLCGSSTKPGPLRGPMPAVRRMPPGEAEYRADRQMKRIRPRCCRSLAAEEAPHPSPAGWPRSSRERPRLPGCFRRRV